MGGVENKFIVFLALGSTIALTSVVVIFYLADHGSPSLIPWLFFFWGAVIVAGAVEERGKTLARERERRLAALGKRRERISVR